MMKKYRSSIIYLLLLCLMVLTSKNSYAQITTIDDGKLIYRRIVNNVEQINAATPFVQHTLSLSPQSCAAISPNGAYVANSLSTGSNITIQRLSTGDIISEVIWQGTWAPCMFQWLNDETLRVKLDGIQEFADVNIYTNVTNPFILPSYTPPQYPQLPDRFADQPVLPSPSNALYLYETCLGNQSVITDRNEILCNGDVAWVVYDSIVQNFVANLDTLESIYSEIAPYSSAVYATWDGVAWSPDSRFLAYVTPYFGRSFPLYILDTLTAETIEPDFVNVDVNVLQGMFWSPNSRRLAVWVDADLNNIENESDQKSLIIVDTNSNQITTVDPIYSPLHTSQNGYWSPNSSSFAFIDISNNLINVDVSTGVLTIVDTGVQQIENWISLITPQANAGPNQVVIDADNDGSELVSLDATSSSDVDGLIVNNEWSESGSIIATGANPQVSLNVGIHNITLTVTDDDGTTSEDVVIITVEDGSSAGCDVNVDASNVNVLKTQIGTANSIGTLLNIQTAYAGMIATLPFHHRDPFDRLIIAQSRMEGFPVIGKDAIFDDYGVERHW